MRRIRSDCHLKFEVWISFTCHELFGCLSSPKVNHLFPLLTDFLLKIWPPTFDEVYFELLNCVIFQQKEIDRVRGRLAFLKFSLYFLWVIHSFHEILIFSCCIFLNGHSGYDGVIYHDGFGRDTDRAHVV